MKIILKIFGYLLLCIIGLSTGLFLWFFAYNPSSPIPSDDRSQVRSFIGAPAKAKPVTTAPLPEHPWLAKQGINSMHNDSYQSDAYQWMGPLGINPQVNSQRFHNLLGACVAATWDKKGNMIQTCVTPFGVTLVARDTDTLNILARKKITQRSPFKQSFSGGVYFHLDHQDKVLLASNDPAIQLWSLAESNNNLSWQLDQSIDIGEALNQVKTEPHAVIDVMPDWQGNYWFITRGGLVGVSDREGNTIKVIALDGEGIDNALAIGKNGVFIVSNHAMYRFEKAEDGTPDMIWRQTYDRGSAPKPGTMGHGSGTTPTLVGDDYVAITDNADGQVNVLVYQQQTQHKSQDQLICQQPVFAANKGTSENSMAAVGNALIVENNFGYLGPFDNIDAEPGIARIDITSNQRCHTVWENRTISSPSAVPKVSLANGLIYLYSRDTENDPALQAWYFTAVDFETGELAFKVLTGIGAGYNNHYGSMSLGEDGVMYLSVLQGLVAVSDG